MKANEVLLEDNWWSDRAKKLGLNIASTVSSQAEGALQARRRATLLMKHYKRALGQGLDNNPIDLVKWLRQGENAVAPSLIKTAAQKANLDLESQNPISISQARDFMVALSGTEMKLSSNPKFKQTQQQTAGKSKPQTKIANLDPDTLDAIATAVAQKLKS